MREVPQRLRWAVEVIAPKPDERLLEIGCGRGIAVQLIAAQLGQGRITAIDRSPVAIAAAEARNRAAIEAGRVRLVQVALAEAQLEERIDRAFAVNVNTFWQKPARELEALDRILAPRGSLLLFFEPPSADQAPQLERACVRQLTGHGFEIDAVAQHELPPRRGLCIIARPKRRRPASV